MKKSMMIILMGTLFSAGLVKESNAAVPASRTAHVPGTMNYQGRLVAPGGTPYVDGTYTFDIRMYNVANGGTPLWGGTYSAYVKDGYFNIMLGNSGGQALSGTTYTHTDLWKALWPDAANGNIGSSLFLGVTPWQGPNGANLATKVELTPRQTLMTAPYAFRAQTADSANRANSGFDVTGTVTADDINIDGEMIRTSGNIVNVGGPNGNITANYVNLNAYGVDIDSGAADIYMNSTDRIDVNAAGYFDVDAGTVTVDAIGVLDLESQGSYTYLKGKTGVSVSSSSGAITLNPQTKVVGYDQLTWNVPGTTQQYSPIRFYSETLTFGANSYAVTKTTGISVTRDALIIVGLSASESLIREFYTYKSSATGYWVIRLERGATTSSDTVIVHLMAISQHWVTDYR